PCVLFQQPEAQHGDGQKDEIRIGIKGHAQLSPVLPVPYRGKGGPKLWESLLEQNGNNAMEVDKPKRGWRGRTGLSNVAAG
ncbi:MAG TPA: hypothetical protein VFA87_08635, partial [Rhizomicrobium sp.]|nr:hypothetical protein [Rhizomicrobium sp.]